jgi:predicted Zn-dependent protease
MLLCWAVPAGTPPAEAKEIDDVDAEAFSFGAMAMGQAKDVEHARAEGLGLVPGLPLEAHLNGILAKLLAQSPVTGVPARVYVRASGDWGARTTADANIYVSLGTLLRLDDEDEVAALLAHEAAHAILGHADADVVTSVQQRVVQVSAVALGARELLAPGGGGKPAPVAAVDARVEEQSQALLINTLVVVPAWNRSQERSADLLGIDLLARAGYDPRAMISLLQKQKELEARREAAPQSKYLEEQLSVFGIDLPQSASEQGKKVAPAAGKADNPLGALIETGVNEAPEAQSYMADVYVAAGPARRVSAWDDATEQPGPV